MRNRIIACSHRWRSSGAARLVSGVHHGRDRRGPHHHRDVRHGHPVPRRGPGAGRRPAGLQPADGRADPPRQPASHAGLVKDVHAMWELPLALLLPPLYGLLVPIPRMVLVQWRVRATLVHRRVFTAAAVGLSYGAASAAFHGIEPVIAGSVPGAQARVLAWALAAAGCGVLKSAVNKVLVMTAVKGADPAASVRAQLFTREPLFHDAAELSAGVIVANAATSSLPGPGRPAISGAAAPFLPARPAGRRVPHRRQDRPAQRRYLAAGSPAGGRRAAPDPDPARGGDRRHRQPLQGRQRHVRAPGRGTCWPPWPAP